MKACSWIMFLIISLISVKASAQSQYLFFCLDNGHATFADIPCSETAKSILNLSGADLKKSFVVNQPKANMACESNARATNSRNRANRLQYIGQRLQHLLEHSGLAKAGKSEMEKAAHQRAEAKFALEKQQILEQFADHKTRILTARCESINAEEINEIFDLQLSKVERLSSRDKLIKARKILDLELERSYALYGVVLPVFSDEH